MRKQSDVLLYVSNTAPQPNRVPCRGIASFDENRPGVLNQEPIDEFQESGFSCATSADESQDIAWLNGTIEMVEHRRPAGTVK